MTVDVYALIHHTLRCAVMTLNVCIESSARARRWYADMKYTRTLPQPAPKTYSISIATTGVTDDTLYAYPAQFKAVYLCNIATSSAWYPLPPMKEHNTKATVTWWRHNAVSQNRSHQTRSARLSQSVRACSNEKRTETRTPIVCTQTKPVHNKLPFTCHNASWRSEDERVE